jgi:hypothetical protein
MSMSEDEFQANLTVQSLKPEVYEAENQINAATLSSLTGVRLQQLIDAVDKSIRKRKALKSMGSDVGHLQRITREESFLSSLRQEAAARDQAEWARKSAAQAAALKAVKLPAASTWGQKK